MTSSLLSALLISRLDEICLIVLAIIACGRARHHVRQGALTDDLSRSTFVSVIVIALLGVGLAEIAARAAGYPASGSLAMAAVARVGALVIAASVIGLLLVSAARIVRCRAEVRSHADLERQLQQAKAALDQANRAKHDFLAVMSHEIRTPLNAVLGFATLLGESRLDDAQRGYVGTIKSEGCRLDSLLNDILDLTKIDEGRLVLERLPFAPAETAHEVMRLLSPRAMEKKIDLRFEAQLAGPLLVSGDPVRFHQILFNLIENAIKFTPRGSVTLFLSWEPPVDSSSLGTLSIRVRDTGIGISAEKVKDLFTMFMQADTSSTRRYGGTGLGLAICQRLVGLMGGQIAAQSTAGEGSEFSFNLGLAPLPVPPSAAPAPAPTVAATRVYAPRILVVDDMETNRFLLEVFLRRSGFEPELAAGGAEAIRMATKNDYDAILMDLQMPDLDGYTATQRIRAAEPAGRHTPIIALTASIGKGTREKCLAAGMDEHLTKPLDLKKFKAMLDTFIGATVMGPALG